MIIWTSKPTTETEPALPEYGRRSWRWALSISPLSVSLTEQVLFDKGPLWGRKWRHGVRYYNVSVTRHFYWGASHTWYDGPHCNRSFGFLHFNWSGTDCEKCENEI